MSDPATPKTFPTVVTDMYVNGKRVNNADPPPVKPVVRVRNPPDGLDPNIFAGPKLKIDRAKCHIEELKTALQAFNQMKPYELTRETDPKTGENVYRVRIKEALPQKCRYHRRHRPQPSRRP